MCTSHLNRGGGGNVLTGKGGRMQLWCVGHQWVSRRRCGVRVDGCWIDDGELLGYRALLMLREHDATRKL